MVERRLPTRRAGKTRIGGVTLRPVAMADFWGLWQRLNGKGRLPIPSVVGIKPLALIRVRTPIRIQRFRRRLPAKPVIGDLRPSAVRSQSVAKKTGIRARRRERGIGRRQLGQSNRRRAGGGGYFGLGGRFLLEQCGDDGLGKAQIGEIQNFVGRGRVGLAGIMDEGQDDIFVHMSLGQSDDVSQSGRQIRLGNSGSPADSIAESAGLSAARAGGAAAGAAAGSKREKAPRRRIATAPTASRAAELREMGPFMLISIDAPAAKVFKKNRPALLSGCFTLRSPISKANGNTHDGETCPNDIIRQPGRAPLIREKNRRVSMKYIQPGQIQQHCEN